MTLLQFFDRVSPYACRLLARKRVGHATRRLTIQEISDTSGLSKRTIIRLSKKVSWDSVDVGTASRFMAGCGIDPFKLSKHIDYLKKASQNPGGAFRYLKSKSVRNYLYGLIPD